MRHGRCRRVSSTPRVGLFLVFLLLLGNILSVHAEDDEYVRAVLEEERRLEEERMKEAGHQYDDAYIQEQERLKQQRQQEEKDRQARVEQEKLERVRRQREEAYERELQSMSEEKQKEAQKQKRRDAAVVAKTLKASGKGNHYGVLGLFNMEVTVGPLRILGDRFKLGPYTLFRIDGKKIRRAYRTKAMSVHPDKNRDGRAQEAFVAVEASASLLLDAQQRQSYDEEVRLARKQQRDNVMRIVHQVISTVRLNISRVVWIFRRILGPFATPIFIILCLLV